MTFLRPSVSRRDFIKQTTLATAAVAALPRLARAQASPSGQRLNVAIIGVGGKGLAAVQAMQEESIVAFCDVDEESARETYQSLAQNQGDTWNRHKDAPRFNDYRRMFDRLGGQIDAVIISIPDHMHFPAAMTAMSLGKHVYVQKPLTHTIWEARELRRVAAERKVVTQMGNQGHAGEGCRLLKEWVQAGVIGEVREIYSWTDRPNGFWPQGVALPDHSKLLPVVPKTLNWDAWIGVANPREYDPAYAPFNWRGWWEFGCGALGDMGCHVLDGAYWALDVGPPTAVEAFGSAVTEQSAPKASVIRMEFPARGAKPPITWMWYDGGLLPPLPADWPVDRALPRGGTFICGSKALVFADETYGSVRIIPEVKMREMAASLPPKTIPRVEGGPFAEWARAIKGGPKPGSNFDYSAPLTETVLLGNVALRAKRRIEWDSAAMKVTNLPAANHFLTKQYRPGWL